MTKKNNMIPMSTRSSGILPKLVGGLVIVALLVIVVKHPGEAAEWAKQILNWLGGVLDGLVSFFQQVGS
jgi:uncharacterized membrane protein YdcZ (DUF606 family)